ncbi:proteasome maturation protein [Drosophila madeirensis]|uniref:Blast:Proteasome maturation protein n=3 Tax=obscura subgroup TaxID=32357 RepID=A0A3B0K3K3_DROGU|nr:proteasome maturation protein [Drosophila guanche]XP_034666276.1 proteasome maturation protein [Drosophila subobscura]SPP79611.1 blast:Proteasome maturation protein [Drosophila guanche]
MNQQSLKVQPSELTVLHASGKVGMPTEENCYNQLAHVHRLRDSEANYHEHQYSLNMQMLRNREGLGIPLKMGMERHSARQIGRLPFLPSSNFMDEVLTGRNESIDFEDFLGLPEYNEHMRQPHAVVEKSLGIY